MNLLNNEYPPFYNLYVSKALELDKGIVETLQSSLTDVFLLFSSIPKEKHLYAYEDGKWTIKELLSHIIDTERILSYRALRISRNDKLDALPFNEDEFVINSNANEIPFKDLLKEYSLVRKSIIAMFESFNEELLLRKGKASSNEFTVRAFAYIISGHAMHHVDIINERYL